jgi:Zn-dependent metalloprotease
MATSQNITDIISSFKNKTQAVISINKNLKIPSFVKFPINKPLSLKGNTIEQKVNDFLNTNKSMYAIKDVNESLKFVTLKTDIYGLKHYTLKQQYKGVDVYDAELKFHFDKNENVKSINGNIIPEIEINPIPRLSKNDVSDIALNLIISQNINNSGKELKIITNKLYIFPKGLAQGKI